MSELQLFNEFAEAAGLDQTHDIKRREDNLEICEFMIIDSNPDFWYKPFIGVTFLGIIHRDTFRMNHPLNPNRGILTIKEVMTFKLVGNTKIIYGRTLHNQHLQIL